MFKNMRLWSKLTLLSGVVIALTVMLVAMSYVMITRISSSLGDARGLVGTKLLSAGSDAIWELRFGIANYTLANAENRKKILDGRPKLYGKLEESLKKYGALVSSKEQEAVLKELLEQYRRYKEGAPHWFELIDAGKLEEAADYRAKVTNAAGSAMVKHFNTLLENQSKLNQELTEESQAAADGARTWLIINGGIILLISAISSFLLARSITRPLSRAVDIAKSIAGGRLDNAISVDSRDETGELLDALNHMQGTLNGILREVEDCGRNMEQSAYQIATISNEISEVSKHQEHRSEEVSDAMRQLHEISSAMQAQAAEAVERSRQVEAVARDGIGNVQQNIGSMDETTRQVSRASVEIQELEQSAQQIHNIVNTIKEIAGQTNLLALNAAIEAARAGEGGRGFAVVADEVRKLAERTANSATEVGDIVGQLSGKVQQVTSTMEVVVQSVNATQEEAGKSASSIESMAGNAIEAAQANEAISSASHRQLERFGMLETTTETLFSVLKENGSKVETTATIGDELREVTGRLNNVMSGFTFERGIRIEPTRHEKRRVPRAQNSLRVKVTQGGYETDAVSSDFSLTGLRLRLPHALNEREQLGMAVYLPSDDLAQYERQKPLQAAGRVCWQRPDGSGYICGIEFASLLAEQREAIKRCFDFFGKNAKFA